MINYEAAIKSVYKSDMSNASKLELIEELRVRQSRVDFYAFRRYMHSKNKDGWFQRDVAMHLQWFYDDLVAGKRPKMVIEAPPQHGKLLADETPIITPNGWVTHGELKPGDVVYHPSGKPVNVIAVTDKHPANVRVELTNGDVIWCHERHEWTVYNRNKKRTETIETMDMLTPGLRSKPDRNPLFTGEEGKRGCHYTFQLPNVEPLIGCTGVTLDPYVFGVWLGDGSQTKPSITFDDKDRVIIDELELRGFKVINEYTHAATGVKTATFGRSLSDPLRELGVYTVKYGERLKRIPDEYLTAPLNVRLELLAGLIDTDGYVYPRNGRTVFTTADVKLADSFCNLVSTFGWSFSRVIEKPKVSSSGIVGKRDYYVIGFNPTLEIPCVLERKRSGRLLVNKRRTAIKRVTVEPCGKVGHCIQVDSPDGLYLAGRTMKPTHNSVQIVDFIAWLSGKAMDTKTIYTSFSDRLGVRANLALQRIFTSSRYQRVFPSLTIPGKRSPSAAATVKLKNREIIEFVEGEGYFRNTTVQGSITGESLDLGVIDDPIRGRKDANSITVRNSAWDWFTDDFFTRFSEEAGLLAILTRWHVDDPIGRLIDKYPEVKVCKYKAIATENEFMRNEGEPLFPEHKSLDFLNERKAIMPANNWEALYQQSPYIQGGNIVKGSYFGRYTVLPKLKFRAMFGDTAFKKKESSDYQVALCAGLGDDGRLYLIDILRDKFEADELEKRFPDFWHKHRGANPARLRYFGIEDKASGTELIQRMQKKIKPKIPVRPIPRSIDKYTRVSDVLGYIESGYVMLPDGAPWVADFIAECEAFTADDAHDNDDQIDTLCDAISQMLHNGKPTLSEMM